MKWQDRLDSLHQQLLDIETITPSVVYKIDENTNLVIDLKPGFIAMINEAVREHILLEIEEIEIQMKNVEQV